MSLSQHVSELLEASDREEKSDVRQAALEQMEVLFSSIKGFRAEPLIPRGELYDR